MKKNNNNKRNAHLRSKNRPTQKNQARIAVYFNNSLGIPEKPTVLSDSMSMSQMQHVEAEMQQILTNSAYASFANSSDLRELVSSYLISIHMGKSCDEAVSRFRSAVAERSEYVNKWEEFIRESETIDVSEVCEMISNLVYMGSDKHVLPKLLAELISAFGSAKSKELLMIIGRFWTQLDRIYTMRDQLEWMTDIVRANRSLSQVLMDEEKASRTALNHELYNSLPERLTVYRGCYDINSEGFCWTTSKEIANRFPQFIRNVIPFKPMVLKGVIYKSDILFCKNTRNEFEVVVHPSDVQIVSTESVTPIESKFKSVFDLDDDVEHFDAEEVPCDAVFESVEL